MRGVERQVQSMGSKIEIAQRAFDKFYAQCFWYLRPDLQVREQDLPTIIDGLRKHGNREAFLLAAELCR